MKKIFTLLLILLLASCSTAKKHPSEKVICDLMAQPLFDRFVQLAEENNLDVDYSKIHSINVVPLNWGIEGLYHKQSEIILLNLGYTVPAPIAEQLTPNQLKLMSEESIFFILSHEIGHSQGMEHLPNGSFKLMAEGDRSMYFLIVAKGEDVICEAFKQKK